MRGITPGRVRKVLAQVAAGYSHTQLRTYFRWVFHSDDRWARHMRKRERPYLSLENLFRKKSLREKVPQAMAWAAEQDERVEVVYGGRVYR